MKTAIILSDNLKRKTQAGANRVNRNTGGTVGLIGPSIGYVMHHMEPLVHANSPIISGYIDLTPLRNQRFEVIWFDGIDRCKNNKSVFQMLNTVRHCTDVFYVTAAPSTSRPLMAVMGWPNVEMVPV